MPQRPRGFEARAGGESELYRNFFFRLLTLILILIWNASGKMDQKSWNIFWGWLIHIFYIWLEFGVVQQIIQNKAIRHIFWNEYHRLGFSTAQLYAKHRILNVTQMIRYENVLTVYKIRNGLMKSEFAVPSNNELDIRSLRRQSLLNIPESRTNYHRNSVLHRGVNWFNELPHYIRHSPTLDQFKIFVKQHILQQWFVELFEI